MASKRQPVSANVLSLRRTRNGEVAWKSWPSTRPTTGVLGPTSRPKRGTITDTASPGAQDVEPWPVATARRWPARPWRPAEPPSCSGSIRRRPWPDRSASGSRPRSGPPARPIAARLTGETSGRRLLVARLSGRAQRTGQFLVQRRSSAVELVLERRLQSAPDGRAGRHAGREQIVAVD